MEAPLSAQPDRVASGAPQPRRQRPRKGKKQHRERETHFTRALKWARNVPIPSHYPISDKPWSGKPVYDPKGCRQSLIEYACWCGEDYVERNGYVPQIPLRPTADSDYPGLLAALGISINVHRKRMSALGRLGIVTKDTQGTGNQGRGTVWTSYRLNIPPVVSTFQPEILSEENRTHNTLPMPEKHGYNTLPMPEKHGYNALPMPEKHGYNALPMPGRHGYSLYMTSERDRTTEEGPSDITMQPRTEGGEDGASFCSDFLIPAFENVGLTGLTAYALAHIEPRAARFAEIHGESSWPDVAGYIAERVAKFIDQHGIDLAEEPHRILSTRGGYLRSPDLLSVFDGMSLRFKRPESEPREPMPEAKSQSEPSFRRHVSAEDWQKIHSAHSAPRLTGKSRTQHPAQTWDAALGELQLNVARPAFETWLRDTDGLADGNGEFVVGAANAFVAEMLEHRMYPLVERAIEKVTGEPLSVRFVVASSGDGCPLCREEE